MNPEDQAFLRSYLRKKIAEKNTQFAKMSSRFKETARVFRMEVFTSFARGINGSNAVTPSNLNLMSAREHIARTGNRMSPYNYFDLDTLIAYDSYWESILTQADDFRVQDGRQFFNSGDFDKAKYVVSKHYIQNQGTKQTGYYNLARPVTILRDENRRPVFERTPDVLTFNKKYKYNDCELLLDDYIYERYSYASFINMEEDDCQENVQVEEEIEWSLPSSFEYDKMTFDIEDSQVYLSESFQPIRLINARSVDKEYVLTGYFDREMNPYYGKVYDLDKKVVESLSGLWLKYIGDHQM